MSSGVLLARVSLQDKVLCVCDVRGVIVFASADAYLLGLPTASPATCCIGTSLIDLLCDEDRQEYRNAMRRRSGSLLRTLQGAFVWLDIQHCSPVTPRLRKALHRVERVRTAALSTNNGRGSSANGNGGSGSSSNNNPRSVEDNEARKAKGSGKWAGMAAAAYDELRDHVLSKERTLEWFTDPAAAGSGAAARAAGSDDGSDDSGSEEMDHGPAAGGLPSLDSLSLHPSESCSSGASSRASEDELLGWGMEEEEDEEEVQREQQKRRREALMTNLGGSSGGGNEAEKPMGREYSFREIFEYIGRTSGQQASRQSGLSLQAMDAGTPKASRSRGGNSSGSSSSTAAAARAVAAVALKASQRPHAHAKQQQQHSQQHQQAQHLPFRERMGAKCRGAPEGNGGSSYGAGGAPSSSSSWLSGVGSGAIVAAKAVAAVAEETGWDWFVELDLVG